jgi:hypothetical protein
MGSFPKFEELAVVLIAVLSSVCTMAVVFFLRFMLALRKDLIGVSALPHLRVEAVKRRDDRAAPARSGAQVAAK